MLPTVDSLNPLANGTRLQEFVIERLIGIGGFGIVYQANDTLLHRTVAIKEYMPTSMAARSDGTTVSLLSASHGQDFEAGKTSFINEARMLARFKHPALIEVFRFWEQNSTAYMATPYYEGQTLKERLIHMQSPPDEALLKKFLMPVLDALAHMHGEQIYHRDISPDNIMILLDDRPVLLDLGAARRQEANNSQAMTVLVKPGYAPIEQYAGDGQIAQGAWTDIYGWGASAYFALTGKAPPPSASRIMNDSITRLTDAGLKGYSYEFLAGIDAALAVRPDDRPQSVAALLQLFSLDLQSPVSAPDDEPTLELARPVAPTEHAQEVTITKTQTSLQAAQTSNVIPTKKSNSSGIIAAAIVAIIALSGAFLWFAKTPPAEMAKKPDVKVITKPTEITETAKPPTTPPATPPAIAAEKAPEKAPEPPPAKVAEKAIEKPAEAIVEKTLEKTAEKPAVARLAIKPWGEVYVNGENRGVSPPLKSLSLAAGTYSIEIRNGDYPPHKLNATLKAGEVFKVTHAFADSAPK
jgi:serine/threonine protein kinase